MQCGLTICVRGLFKNDAALILQIVRVRCVSYDFMVLLLISDCAKGGFSMQIELVYFAFLRCHVLTILLPLSRVFSRKKLFRNVIRTVASLSYHY